MKAIISGDWHIRIKSDIPEDWQLNRYRLLFKTVIQLCKEHEAFLFLSGDIADRNRPSLLEMQLLIELFTLLSDERIDTWLISGNHEAIGQNESTFDYLLPLFQKINQQDKGQIRYQSSNLMMATFPTDRVAVTFVGHPALGDAADYHSPDSDTQWCNVLISHFRPTVNQFIREEIDVEALTAPYDYTFASDIHTPLTLSGNLIYTNHPLNSSFEPVPCCGCLLMTATAAGIKWQRVPLKLPNLVQINASAAEFREPQADFDYYRVEVKGTPEELRRIKSESPNVKLLKVPEVTDSYMEQEEAEEIRDTSLEDGLIEYMKGLGLSPQKIEDMMGVYREQ